MEKRLKGRPKKSYKRGIPAILWYKQQREMRRLESIKEGKSLVSVTGQKIAFNIPKSEFQMLENMSRSLQRSKSEILREALHRYLLILIEEKLKFKEMEAYLVKK